MNNTYRVKAPAWFVKGFERADKYLEEALQKVGVSAQWAGVPGSVDAEKIVSYLKLLHSQGNLSDEILDILKEGAKARIYLSGFLWAKFRLEKMQKGENLPDRLNYDPNIKVISEGVK